MERSPRAVGAAPTQDAVLREKGVSGAADKFFTPDVVVPSRAVDGNVPSTGAAVSDMAEHAVPQCMGREFRRNSLGTIEKPPLGLGRVLLLALLIVYAVLTGSHIFNWPPWEEILQLSGVFSHVCSVDSSDADRATVVLANGKLACRLQEQKLAGILFLVNCAMFCFTFVAGMLLDVIGPRVCCLFGCTTALAGWGILALASNATPILYLVGFALVGAAFDPSFFGTLSASNLFPGHESMAIGLLGAARSVSNVFPVMLLPIARANPGFTFTRICIVFILMFLGCVIVVFLLVPWKPYKRVLRHEKVGAVHRSAGDLEAGTKVDPEQLAGPPGATTAGHGRSGYTTGSTTPQEGAQLALREGTTATGRKTNVAAKLVGLSSQQSSAELKLTPMETVAVASSLEAPSKVGKLEHFVHELLCLGHHMGSMLYLPIVVIMVTNIIRNNFYLSASKDTLGSVTNWLTIINVLAFLPGPVMGVLVDRLGPLFVIALLNTTNTIVFLLLIVVEIAQIADSTVTGVALRGTAVILSFPGIGFLISQLYCFVADVFPARDLGKLAGFASVVGGCMGLLAGPMLTFSKQGDPPTFWRMNLLCVAFGVLSYACTGYLWLLMRRRQSHPDQRAPGAASAVAEPPSAHAPEQGLA